MLFASCVTLVDLQIVFAINMQPIGYDAQLVEGEMSDSDSDSVLLDL